METISKTLKHKEFDKAVLDKIDNRIKAHTTRLNDSKGLLMCNGFKTILLDH